MAFSQASQGGFSQAIGGNPSQPGGGAQGRVDYLLPLTVALLKRVKDVDGDLTIFGKKLGQVLMVGLVMEVNEGESKIEYLIGDCTGEVKVTQWKNNQEDDNPGASTNVHPKGIYVKILGKVSMWNDNAQFNAHQIRACESYNEVTQHYLMCNVAALEIKGEQKGQGGGMGGGQANAAPAGVTRGGVSEAFGNGGGGDDVEISDPQAREVYQLIVKNQNKNENGADAKEIGNILGRDITKNIEFLMEEGQIYDTVDSNWVKTTN